jgi:hypothetical protein
MSTAEGGGNVLNDNVLIYFDATNTKSYISGSTIWNDLSPKQYNGSLINGPIFTYNNFGYLSFDGVDDYVEIPYTGILTNKNNFTISMWVYPTSLTGIRPLFVNYYVGNLEVLFRFNNNDLQFFTFTTSLIGGTTQSYSTLNQWVNVVATYDGTTMKTFVNGTESPTSFSQTGGLSVSTLPYLIGRYSSPTEYRFEGRVSNTIVYNRSLTSSEILQNFNATKSCFGF